MRSAVLGLVAAIALVTSATGCKGKGKGESKPAEPRRSRPIPGRAPTRPPPPPKRRQVPFLWEATKDGKTLYLLGTIHVGVDALTQLPPWVLAKLDAAPAFAMETDITDPGVVKLLVRTDGQTLEGELGPTDWARLREALGPALADGMNGMKPFAAMSALALKDLPMTAPMDSVLLARAQKAGKRIVFLETVAAQLAAIEPYATAADIKAILDHAAEAKGQSRAMIAAYLAGDAKALAALFDDQTFWVAAGRDPATYGAFVESTLTRRNRIVDRPAHRDGRQRRRLRGRRRRPPGRPRPCPRHAGRGRVHGAPDRGALRARARGPGSGPRGRDSDASPRA
jgi:uncharacterized protein YbaP (TraB family)